VLPVLEPVHLCPSRQQATDQSKSELNPERQKITIGEAARQKKVGELRTWIHRFQSSAYMSCVVNTIGIFGIFDSYRSSMSRTFMLSKGAYEFAAFIARENASGAGSCCGSVREGFPAIFGDTFP
jgi:hypothetical protein